MKSFLFTLFYVPKNLLCFYGNVEQDGFGQDVINQRKSTDCKMQKTIQIFLICLKKRNTGREADFYTYVRQLFLISFIHHIIYSSIMHAYHCFLYGLKIFKSFLGITATLDHNWSQTSKKLRKCAVV